MRIIHVTEKGAWVNEEPIWSHVSHSPMYPVPESSYGHMPLSVFLLILRAMFPHYYTLLMFPHYTLLITDFQDAYSCMNHKEIFKFMREIACRAMPAFSKKIRVYATQRRVLHTSGVFATQRQVVHTYTVRACECLAPQQHTPSTHHAFGADRLAQQHIHLCALRCTYIHLFHLSYLPCFVALHTHTLPF